jgi:O-antigen/teichoic acid export membrane protein
MGMGKLLKDNELLKHSSILFIASLIAGFLNYLYQVYVGRVLGPSDYSIFSSLVSLLLIISIPSSTILTSVAKLVSEYNPEHGKIKFLIAQAFKKLTLIGGLVSLLFIISSAYIGDFLKIDSRMPFLILSLVLFISFLTPILTGALQGLQMFNQMGINGIAGAFFKLIFGVVLVYFSFGVNGALLALFLGSFFALLSALIPLRFLKTSREVNGNVKFFTYSMTVLFATVGLSFLPNVDILLVKHYFDNANAGYYAAAALLGKVILFITGPIVMVMFPKVSVMHNKKDNKGISLLHNTLLYTGALALSIIIVYGIFPEFVVNVLFGPKFTGIKELLGYFAVALTFFSLTNAVVFYDLATRKYRFLYIFGIVSVIEIVLITQFHESLLNVARILTIAMAILFTGVWFCEKR